MSINIKPFFDQENKAKETNLDLVGGFVLEPIGPNRKMGKLANCKSESEPHCVSKNIMKVQNLARIHRIESHHPMENEKKLLVLDLDLTLISGSHKERPFLHQFLTHTYQHYNLVLWSDSMMYRIRRILKKLKMHRHEDYKFSFYMCCNSVVYVQKGRREKKCKPLELIWRQFPAWGPHNSIIIDDMARNFLMNPQSGLEIEKFRGGEDDTLPQLAKYLEKIAGMDNFSTLNHNEWQNV
ncbi:ubiquitin-like domain-containing CTD phosphatase 1 isoform X2 [Neocloeon triangulifer]|uniref:ubiquitin-like domain-containing CTD phosphatase 1 isoform X2 n=1 Tax=Neocloeon triangulifer TaxID=2078957 RepID=UPI00286F0715|nr:ubiquitin-like domain-containing CTD phosphatase 1 isoform X2 [Neocloeon triangulifer]